MAVALRITAALTLVVLATSCGPAAPAPEAAQADSAHASSTRERLEELAERIDPGAQQRMQIGMPTWLHAPLGLGETTPTDADGLAREAAQALQKWQRAYEASTDSSDRFMELALLLGRAIVLAERAAEAETTPRIEVLVMLDELYAVLDQPELQGKSPLQSLLGWVERLMSSALEGAEAADFEHMVRFLTEALARARPLHRHTAAQLLRRAPDHPQIPDVLQRLAASEQDAERARELMALAVDRRGAGAKADHWAQLASHCFRALDIRCGERALAQMEAKMAKGDTEVKDLDEVRQTATRARRAATLSDATDLDSRLERAQLLEQLDRRARAKAAMSALRRQHPRDARPVVGLARIAMEGSFDYRHAASLIEQARPLEHKDREFYELAVAARAMTLFYGVLPALGAEDPTKIAGTLLPVVQALRGDVDALAGHGSELAVVLQAVLDGFDEVLPLLVAGKLDEARGLAGVALDRALALRAKVPDSPHAYDLMLVAAPLSPDQTRAFTAVSAAPPAGPEHAHLSLRQARTVFSLIATWAAKDKLDELDDAVAALPSGVEPRALGLLRGDAAALRARLTGDQKAWWRAAVHYRDLVGDGRSEDDALVLNNLAVISAEMGQPADAYDVWLQAAQLDEEQKDVPLINLYATRHTAEDYAALEALLAQDDDRHELIARAWLVHLADEPGARQQHAKALRRAAKTKASGGFRPRPTSTPAGVHLAGSLQFGVGYSSKSRFVLSINAESLAWLIRPPPIPLPLAR